MSGKPTLRSGHPPLPDSSPAPGGSSLQQRSRAKLARPPWNPGTEGTAGEQGMRSQSRARLRDVALSKTGGPRPRRCWQECSRRHMVLLRTECPQHWRGSKQRSRSCLCLRSPGQPRPGLDKTSAPGKECLLTSPSFQLWAACDQEKLQKVQSIFFSAI